MHTVKKKVWKRWENKASLRSSTLQPITNFCLKRQTNNDMNTQTQSSIFIYTILFQKHVSLWQHKMFSKAWFFIIIIVIIFYICCCKDQTVCKATWYFSLQKQRVILIQTRLEPSRSKSWYRRKRRNNLLGKVQIYSRLKSLFQYIIHIFIDFFLIFFFLQVSLFTCCRLAFS
jgi:hypothetical protein